jgi:hypothetical protein
LIVEKRAIGVIYNTNNIETCSTADTNWATAEIEMIGFLSIDQRKRCIKSGNQ